MLGKEQGIGVLQKLPWALCSCLPPDREFEQLIMEQLIMEIPGSSCTATTRPSQESFFGGLYLPALLVRGGLRDGLPHPVDTMRTFQQESRVAPGSSRSQQQEKK